MVQAASKHDHPGSFGMGCKPKSFGTPNRSPALPAGAFPLCAAFPYGGLLFFPRIDCIDCIDADLVVAEAAMSNSWLVRLGFDRDCARDCLEPTPQQSPVESSRMSHAENDPQDVLALFPRREARRNKVALREQTQDAAAHEGIVVGRDRDPHPCGQLRRVDCVLVIRHPTVHEANSHCRTDASLAAHAFTARAGEAVKPLPEAMTPLEAFRCATAYESTLGKGSLSSLRRMAVRYIVPGTIGLSG